jgi:hypothetical protein
MTEREEGSVRPKREKPVRRKERGHGAAGVATKGEPNETGLAAAVPKTSVEYSRTCCHSRNIPRMLPSSRIF